MAFGEKELTPNEWNRVRELITTDINNTGMRELTNIFTEHNYGYIRAIHLMRKESGIEGFGIPVSIWSPKRNEVTQKNYIEKFGYEAKIPYKNLSSRNYNSEAKFAYIMQSVFYGDEGEKIPLNKVTMLSNDYLSPLEAETRASEYFGNMNNIDYNAGEEFTFIQVFMNGAL